MCRNYLNGKTGCTLLPLNPLAQVLPQTKQALNRVCHQLFSQLNILLNVFDTLRKQVQQIPFIQRIQLCNTEYQTNRVFPIINKCVIEGDPRWYIGGRTAQFLQTIPLVFFQKNVNLGLS